MYGLEVLEKMEPGRWYTVDELSKLGGRCRRVTNAHMMGLVVSDAVVTRPATSGGYRFDYAVPTP